MQRHHLPALAPRFWFALSLASVVGANLGDLLAHRLGVGHTAALPYLAVAFALTLLAERLVAAPTEAFYWTAIILMRAAATNIGDFTTHELKQEDFAAAEVFILIVGVCSVVTPRPFLRDGKPVVGILYWFTMLMAGTAGTTLGDACAEGLGLGVSTLAWLAIWAVLLAVALSYAKLLVAANYWLVVMGIRTFGTNVGDWMAGRRGLDLGLPIATALSLVLFVAVLLLWRRQARVERIAV